MIKNIKKQEAQIQNILNDMKFVQKEINSLSGKIERSFTVTEKTISAVSIHVTGSRLAAVFHYHSPFVEFG